MTEVNPTPAPVQPVQGPKKLDLEAALVAAGVNVKAAKAKLVELDDAFAGAVGDIPEGALQAWVNQFFDTTKLNALALALGRTWEQEHAASLPADRQWERSDKAAEEKAKRDAEADKKAAEAKTAGKPEPRKPWVSPLELEQRAAAEKAERDRIAAELDAKAAAEREAKIDAELKKSKQPA